MFNMGYYDKDQETITITFPSIGIYSYDEMKVTSLPMRNFDKRVSELRKEQVTNLNYNLDILHKREMTDALTGEVTTHGARILFFSIPYNKGWKAYVDGKETRLYRANVGYMALLLDEGNHEFKLSYQTPLFREGLVISLLFALILVIAFGIKKKGIM